MAINSKNYVDVSTTFPKTGSTARAFGGMVFTYGTALPAEPGSDIYTLAQGFNNGEVVSLDLDETLSMFGIESDEYKFAKKYYGYTSPSGLFPCKLKFKAVDNDKSPLENFKDLDKQTNQFGSFTFLSSANGSSTDESTAGDTDPMVEVAKYNDELDTKYLFVVNFISADSDTQAVVDYEQKFAQCTGVWFQIGFDAASAAMPMAILASTDYENGNVVNFMFKQFDDEVPTVTDNATYTKLNNAYVNFYGRTQSNGQTLDFLQRGFNTDGMETSIYCNEMWFKSACETELLTLLVSSERIPADQTGVSAVVLTVSDICSTASTNGAFMPKEATSDDTKVIREIVSKSGGDAQSTDGIIVDVGVKGYSIYAYLSELSDPEKLGPNPEKIIVYYVFYGTADSIRHIKGNDILLK